MRTTYRQQRKDLIDKYVIFKKLKEEVERAIQQNNVQSQTQQIYGTMFNSVTSFDQLQLEDELEQFFALFAECEGINEMETNIPLQELVVRIYLREIREPGRESQFEEYLKQNLGLYSGEDLKVVNLVHQILDEKEIQHLSKQDRVRKEEKELLQEEVQYKLKRAAEEVEEARKGAEQKYGKDAFVKDQVFEEESKGQGLDLSNDEISPEEFARVQKEKIQKLIDNQEQLINSFKKQYDKLEALKETEREKLVQKKKEREEKKAAMRSKVKSLRDQLEKAKASRETEADYSKEETRARQVKK